MVQDMASGPGKQKGLQKHDWECLHFFVLLPAQCKDVEAITRR